MKDKLHKLTALTLAGLSIVTIGACSRKIKVDSTKVITKEETIGTTLKSTEPTTFSIFEDPELLTTTEVYNDKEDISIKESESILETTHARENVESRFSNEEELEAYLNNIYQNSGKNYIEIINEFHESQKENYYIYREDLYTSAAYTALRECGYTLEELSLELNYLLTAAQNSREVKDEDLIALEKLYVVGDNITNNGGIRINIYQLFEQLSLEYHKVSCTNKEEHEKGNRYILCETLDEEKLYAQILASKQASLTYKIS